MSPPIPRTMRRAAASSAPEGATVAALAQIARMVGVWQGGFLRASFDHHPLRARDAAGSIDEGASNGAAAAIAAREVS